MNGTWLSYSFFWSIWLLVPILLDGLFVLMGAVGALIFHLKRKTVPELDFAPKVSVVIPVKNGEKMLEACIRSVASQNYPAKQLEILVIDNGSTDRSFEVFQGIKNIEQRMVWHSITGRGKAWAINSGIYLSQAQYFINIDCDLVLEPDAVNNAVAYLEAHEDVGTATGYLVILPQDEKVSTSRKMLAQVEFMEYASVFEVGRANQTLLNALFTLSGAFTVFRRNVLLKTFLYNQDTVSEDTEMTFQLYSRASEYRIVLLHDAIAYLQPTESWKKLYSQRVRWQRGALEVCSLHQELMNKSLLKIRGVSLLRLLLVDHTLSLPRLVWLVLLPMLVNFGYQPSMIFASYIMMYVFYLIVEIIWWLTAAVYARKEVRKRILNSYRILPLMPFYRIITFLFRVSGFIYAIKEPFTWTVSNPMEQLETLWKDMKTELHRIFTLVKNNLTGS
ncbi:MAG: glycosyltransferase [Anaerolineaceae bacterium]|nr:glycosyltransferase [Anaerolineaceae bacterium]